MKINNRSIGLNSKPLVIVEIGINHEGSIETAFEMVDAAYNSGAEIIKHQTHIIDDEMSSESKNIIPGNSKDSIYSIMKRCALNKSDEIKLKNYVESKGMIFISTPFSRAAADRLEEIDVSAYKIGSGECNNYPLIKHISSFKKPIILSTGMNDIKSIEPAVNIMRNEGIDFALLHTTNLYPTPNNLVRLNAMSELAKAFPDAIIGLSDHTVTNHACFGAVALGASILERHFTDSMQRKGPDIVCSMDPTALEELIRGSEIIYNQRDGNKSAVIEEAVTINFAFASVVSIAPIKKGEKFSEQNIWVKRPGTGEYLAKDYESLLGRCACNDINENVQIAKIDVE